MTARALDNWVEKGGPASVGGYAGMLIVVIVVVRSALQGFGGTAATTSSAATPAFPTSAAVTPSPGVRQCVRATLERGGRAVAGGWLRRPRGTRGAVMVLIVFHSRSVRRATFEPQLAGGFGTTPSHHVKEGAQAAEVVVAPASGTVGVKGVRVPGVIVVGGVVEATEEVAPGDPLSYVVGGGGPCRRTV